METGLKICLGGGTCVWGYIGGCCGGRSFIFGGMGVAWAECSFLMADTGVEELFKES